MPQIGHKHVFTAKVKSKLILCVPLIRDYNQVYA